MTEGGGGYKAFSRMLNLGARGGKRSIQDSGVRMEVDRYAVTVLRIPCLASLSLDSAGGMTAVISR